MSLSAVDLHAVLAAGDVGDLGLDAGLHASLQRTDASLILLVFKVIGIAPGFDEGPLGLLLTELQGHVEAATIVVVDGAGAVHASGTAHHDRAIHEQLVNAQLFGRFEGHASGVVPGLLEVRKVKVVSRLPHLQRELLQGPALALRQLVLIAAGVPPIPRGATAARQARLEGLAGGHRGPLGDLLPEVIRVSARRDEKVLCLAHASVACSPASPRSPCAELQLLSREVARQKFNKLETLEAVAATPLVHCLGPCLTVRSSIGNAGTEFRHG
mmetsp:Transcript_22859/g.65919  ORF Transcript_22859/g.65919 Transcript_22859/m.65919 type:complete len:271 (-) Transcript_22859:218-1030(-)